MGGEIDVRVPIVIHKLCVCVCAVCTGHFACTFRMVPNLSSSVLFTAVIQTES